MSEVASRPEVIASKEGKMPTSGTSIELIVREYLTDNKIVFEANKQIEKKYNVDMFIKPNKIIECDGDYWHSLERVKSKDIIRDKILKSCGYDIIRLSEEEISNSMFTNKLSKII